MNQDQDSPGADPTSSVKGTQKIQKIVEFDVHEEAKKLIAFQIADNAKRQVMSWLKWTAGILFLIVAALGVKTYFDIQNHISRATEEQIEFAKQESEEMIKETGEKIKEKLQVFEKEHAKALENFDRRAKNSIKELEKQKVTAVKDIRDKHLETISEIATATKDNLPAKLTRTVDRQGRVRPIGPGISVSIESYTSAGTICCVVEDKDGTRYILSESSIFGADLRINKPNTPVLQPGTLDGGAPEKDKVAAFTRTSQTEYYSDQDDILSNLTSNRTSAALAKVDGGIDLYYDVPEIGSITGIAEKVQLGETLQKYGRTSGLTKGLVTDKDEVSTILFTVGSARFSGMIRVEGIDSSFSKPGDGGAPVLNNRDEIIGYIIGRSGEGTLVLPIRPSLKELEVSLLVDKDKSID